MINTTTKPYGGYALTSFKEAGGDETLRFEAFITLNGKKVMHVSNGGTGGSHMYRAVADDYAAFRAARDAFETFAKTWNADSEFAGIEDGDALVYRLIEVRALSRMRSVPFLLDDMDFWQSGECHKLRGTPSRAAVLDALRTTYVHRQPRIWVPEAGDFVPVV